MVVFKVAEQDVKLFMRKLLREDLFFAFEARGAEVVTFASFKIDSRLDPPAEGRAYCPWRDLQPYVVHVIQGGRRPKLLKLVLSLPAARAAELHANAAAYFLNIVFENDVVLCTAASSEKAFKMDKTVDYVWEDFLRNFFRQGGLPVEELA